MQRLLQANTEDRDDAATKAVAGTSRISFHAVIPRRRDPQHELSTSAMAPRDADAAEGAEEPNVVDPAQVTAAFTAPASDVPNAEAGETVTLPDMQMPEALQMVDNDAIASTITFSPTITQTGVVSPFGATTWSNFNITGTTVTPSPGPPPSFTATFTLENPITFNVTSTNTDIASENDPALTNTNYPTAASDLTPNMSDLGGRPPRTQFWASDLTTRHERFHSDERSRLNRAGATQAQTWLNSQMAGSVADVQALIAQVPGKVITASQAAVGTVAQKESRAYGDGAPSYQARADAIRTKGAKGPTGGGYP